MNPSFCSMRQPYLARIAVLITTAWSVACVASPPPFEPTDSPLTTLPDFVPTKRGSVTLWADFSKVENGRRAVYLVNRTRRTIDLPAEDRDVYLKLEYQTEGGEWQRAQPHVYSWCGHSYMTIAVKPNHYLVIEGYAPIQGDKKSVRYRLYSQSRRIVSNSAEGFVLNEDVQKAATDSMAVNLGDFDFVAKVARGLIVRTNEQAEFQEDCQDEAISALASARFDPRQSRELLYRVGMEFPAKAPKVLRSLRKLDLAEKKLIKPKLR